LQKHWIKNINLDCDKLNFNVLFHPSSLSLKCLPLEYKTKAIEKINAHIDFLTNYNNSSNLVSSWKNAIEFMMSEDHSYLLKNFFQSNDKRDKFRNQYFEDYFPDYQNLRTYVK
jgi:hypothetical protein